jgi:phosphohistidine swiveling domain-containing protein
MNYPLDPYGELVKWGPSPAFPFYADWLRGIFVDFPREYPGQQWCKTLQLTKGSMLCAMMQKDELQRDGGKVFLEEMIPKERRERTRTIWSSHLTQLREKEDEIASRSLASLSMREFIDLWRDLHRRIDLFWCWCVVPELGNYAAIDMLRERLHGLVPDADIAEVMEALTAPEGHSFYQEEEIDLVETKDVAAHQRKYFWLRNGYGHIEVLPVAFFADRKREISPNIRAECDARITKACLRKVDIRERYALPEEVMSMAGAIADGVLWQDTRKGDIFQYLHTKDLLVTEAARRSGVSKASLIMLLSDEIADLLEGKHFDLDARINATGFVMYPGGWDVLDEKVALQYWDIYVQPPVAHDVDVVRGIVACKGNGAVRGTVRIVGDPRAAATFKQGEILVTTMTTPEYIFIMKNASAVVTDQGGLMSHAAIVSRELNVPCIVGTKHATQVFKDGDMVEVDAEKGMVRILSRA